uniref:R3H domain-containing protein n=1 Tax=Acanthochromis polyacanthus TaxID=80966 RepID=A0A3Q1G939_9TELE
MSNAGGASQKPARSQKTSPHGSSYSSTKEIHIDEEVKIAVNLSLESFRYNDQKEMTFPSSLTSVERAFIHRMAQSLGYISKSKGDKIASSPSERRMGQINLTLTYPSHSPTILCISSAVFFRGFPLARGNAQTC